MEKTPSRMRRTIRYEAARIMAEDGVRDYRMAKEKACNRIGVSKEHSMPTNLEIEDSLEEQLSIFACDTVEEKHRQYLQTAYEVMQLFQDYSPRLTGAAISGTITSARPVELQVFPDTVEEIGTLLSSNGVKNRLLQKRMRFVREGFRNVTGFEFSKDDVDIETLVFLPGEPYPPLSRTNSKPVKWFSFKKVRRMLAK